MTGKWDKSRDQDEILAWKMGLFFPFFQVQNRTIAEMLIDSG